MRPADAYCFSPAEAEGTRRETLSAERIAPLNCGNVVGSHRKTDPERLPGEHYTRDSYRRAIDRGCEKAFPLPEPLARQPGEGQQQWQQRLGKAGTEQIKAWRKAHHWHPHQLRHNYATFVRKEDNLESAQILMGHSKADVTQIYAERDMERAKRVALKIG